MSTFKMFTNSLMNNSISNVCLILARRPLHITTINLAQPLRKKKTVNPLITKKQFDRKVRRLEREIARLSSAELVFKPIIELELPENVKEEIDERKRKEKDEEAHTLLKSYLRLWSIYKSIEAECEIKQIEMVTKSQERTLKLLKNEYPELYQKAVQLDPELIPYKVENPKKKTPPNLEYNCPDGKLTDITKEWKL